MITAMAGYAVAPGALEASTLLWSCAGIALCSGAANSVNQVRERMQLVKYALSVISHAVDGSPF